MLVKSFSIEDFIERFDVIRKDLRILNAGSSDTRFGDNCVNVDIQAKPNVDIVCDLHALPDDIGTFDAVVCNGVLQYCHSPDVVADSFEAALKEEGLLFVDVPWVQPYCPDTPDRFRFSEDAMRRIFSNFEIVETGPSITSSSAFYMQGVAMAQHATRNRHLNYALSLLVGSVLYPFRYVRTAKESWTAGGVYLIARKRKFS